MPETGTKGNLPEKLSPNFVTAKFPNTVKHAKSANIKPVEMARLVVIAYENGDGNLSPKDIVRKYGDCLRGSSHAIYDATVPPSFEKMVNSIMEIYNHPEFSRNNKSAFKNQFKKGLDLKMLTMTSNQSVA